MINCRKGRYLVLIESERPNPDHLLIKYQQNNQQRGSLKVFFGYAAGVGKTYGMLRAGIEEQASGRKVLIGYVEPHARPETTALVQQLPMLPIKKMNYRSLDLAEFNLEEALKLKPELILVDELAHTNVVGSRNRKRYQDIDELLRAGIDVYTTVNVQHIDSLNDVVEDITGISVLETVPDSFFEEAQIKLIDIEPKELLQRLQAGKIYSAENTEKALNNFFTLENLSLLREIAIRKAADHISLENRFEKTAAKTKIQSKLLVYLDTRSSKGTEKCLRWTARLAAAFRVAWVALYILDEDQDEKGESHPSFELAESLGAETVTLQSDDKIATLVHYAKITGVSDIILGKNRHKKYRYHLFHQEIEDQLINELADVEIHIVPFFDGGKLAEDSKRNHYNFKKKWLNLSDLVKSTSLLLIGTLLSEVFLLLGLGDQNVIVIYLFIVLIISRITEGYLYGALSSIISVLLFNWFFVEPLFSLTVYKAGYPITMVIMFSVALITSNMMIRVKKQALVSVEKEHRMTIIYELNKNLLGTKNFSEIVTLVNNYLGRTLERSIIFYTKDPEKATLVYELTSFNHLEVPQASLLSEEEQAVANWVFTNGQVAGYGSDTLMGAKGYYLPVFANQEVVGVIGILCQGSGPLNYENHNFLKLIGFQLSLAIERQQLADEQQKIMIENVKEKMRGNLLRGISHDLRTPLTGILGASSALLDNKGKISSEIEKQLLTDIKEDSEWLIRMVENILSVTRIDEGRMAVKKDPEAVEEIIGSAVNRIRKRFKEQEIHVEVPSELLLVKMDGKLIEQVLINLMENAIKHGGNSANIAVTVTKGKQEALFKVRDEGRGLTTQELANLFSQQRGADDSQLPIDSKRGLGIGLSICQTIILAHEGSIYGENNEDKGATFSFSLPL